MIEILRLIKIDFDAMENHSPKTESCIATFVNEEDNSAKNKLDNYLKSLGPIKLYSGYDKHLYPKFRIDKEYAE
jgi:hypothetical protein